MGGDGSTEKILKSERPVVILYKMAEITFDNRVGSCFELLKEIPSSSIDLVFTSPPYADARKDQYGGPHPDKYVSWFRPIGMQVQRILKPNGTFLINIKEKVVNGERHPYVDDLKRDLRRRDWFHTEAWIWHKKNCFPGKWGNRFRDAWEFILQFNLRKRFKMNQDSVREPIGDWAKRRLANLSETDQKRAESQSGSPFGKDVSKWVDRDTVYPSNVLHLATECGNNFHPAAFPKELPEFFIKLFTDEGGLVLDPFEGSGTTGVAAVSLNRNYIGIDWNKKYSDIAKRRISEILPEKI